MLIFYIIYCFRRLVPGIYNLACYVLIVPFFLIFSSELLNTPSGPQLALEGQSFHTLRYDLTVYDRVWPRGVKRLATWKGNGVINIPKLWWKTHKWVQQWVEMWYKWRGWYTGRVCGVERVMRKGCVMIYIRIDVNVFFKKTWIREENRGLATSYYSEQCRQPQ